MVVGGGEDAANFASSTLSVMTTIKSQPKGQWKLTFAAFHFTSIYSAYLSLSVKSNNYIEVGLILHNSTTPTLTHSGWWRGCSGWKTGCGGRWRGCGLS